MRENKVVIDVPNNSLNFPDKNVVHFSNLPGNPKGWVSPS